MKDINYILRKKYYEVIKAIQYNSKDLPVFYGYAPDNYSADVYVVISSINTSSIDTKTTTDEDFTIQIGIYSYEQKNNSGVKLDNVAGDILEAIKPTPTSVLDLSADNLQMVNLRKVSDNLQTISLGNNGVYINRFINFRSQILIK